MLIPRQNIFKTLKPECTEFIWELGAGAAILLPVLGGPGCSLPLLPVPHDDSLHLNEASVFSKPELLSVGTYSGLSFTLWFTAVVLCSGSSATGRAEQVGSGLGQTGSGYGLCWGRFLGQEPPCPVQDSGVACEAGAGLTAATGTSRWWKRR